MVSNMILHLHTLIAAFSKQTDAISVSFAEDKKIAEWTVKYNLIKIQFVLTKKEKILCPISTLFCRIYLGKNDTYFYHLPELMEYLEPENFKCYYFPYIESEKRMNACFTVLEAFLKKHLAKMNGFAKCSKMSGKIKEAKMADMEALFTKEAPVSKSETEPEKELLSAYESYVLLPRYTAEGSYRDFVCGNYKKALKSYKKSAAKEELSNYERRLMSFIEEIPTGYEAIPKECETIQKVKALDSPPLEGVSILLTALVIELVLGVVYAGIVAVISGVLSSGTLYYAGMSWYFGFLFAGLPAVFGGIAFKNHIRRHTQKEKYEETTTFEKLMNPRWANALARIVFVITLILTVFINVSTSFVSARFYAGYMTFNEGEELISESITCEYADLKNVYYSEGGI